MPLDAGPQFVDAFTTRRLRHDQFGDPTAEVEHFHHRANLVLELIRHRVVLLVDHEDIGNLQNARFEHLDAVAAAGLQRNDRRLCEFGNFDLGLSDTDGFDDDDVLAECVHQQHRVRRGSGEAAQVAAAGHRPDKNFAICKVFGQANAIAQQRPVRKRRTGIHRHDTDALAQRAHFANERVAQGGFADARRSRQTDRQCAPGLREKMAHELGAPSGFRAADRARQRTWGT